MPDIVADFIDRLLVIAPGVDTRAAERLAYDLRQYWGGERIYIARAPRQQTAFALRSGLIDPDQKPERTVRRYRRGR